MPRAHPLKIGVSGIRGVVGEFLTPALALEFAQAFGTYVGGGRVVVGRDTRSSGPMLQHAVQCGLLATGCEVVDVGVVPTPTLQVYIANCRARGGLSLTASHNPPEYNALKLFNHEGLFFNHYERGELLDIFHQSEFRQVPNSGMCSIQHDAARPPELHIERILKHIDPEPIRARRLRIGLDGVNGAGSLLSVHFLKDVLGCELHAISVDPEKPFPRIAEPRPDTLGDLSSLVQTDHCQIGFAQDPDGDRLSVCDENGRILDNDDVLALVIDAALPAHPGDVVVNLTTSSVIEEIAARHGRKVWRTPVGEANVVETMRAIPTAIGGEGSNGGVIFPGVHLCRDSYIGMAFLLARLASSGKTVSRLQAELPRYFRKLGKVMFEHGRLGSVMQSLEGRFPAAAKDRTDGLKLVFPDAWLHVRASNTEPVIRFGAEAKSQARLDSLYEEAQEILSGRSTSDSVPPSPQRGQAENYRGEG